MGFSFFVKNTELIQRKTARLRKKFTAFFSLRPYGINGTDEDLVGTPLAGVR